MTAPAGVLGMTMSEDGRVVLTIGLCVALLSPREWRIFMKAVECALEPPRIHSATTIELSAARSDVAAVRITDDLEALSVALLGEQGAQAAYVRFGRQEEFQFFANCLDLGPAHPLPAGRADLEASCAR